MLTHIFQRLVKQIRSTILHFIPLLWPLNQPSETSANRLGYLNENLHEANDCPTIRLLRNAPRSKYSWCEHYGINAS